MSNPKTPKSKSLAQQLDALDEIVAWFDQPDFDLDQALAKFDEGVALTEEIKTKLSTFENKITVLKQRFETPSDL